MPASSHAPADRASVRTAVNLLALAGFLSGAALRICDGLIPRIASDFALSAGTAGRVVLTFSIAYGVSQLLFGPLGDRFGKARMVCVALLGCAIGAFACTLAPGFEPLVAVRALWGMAAAGVVPVSIAWVGDAVPYEERQETLARLLLGILTGMTAGQLLGGAFADSPLGWRGGFATLGVGYVLVGFLLFTRLRRMPAAPAPTAAGGSGLGAVLGIGWARVVLAAALAEGVCLLGPQAFLPAYLHQRFGISLTAASGLVALSAVGGIAYSLAARHIIRRFGERRMVSTGGVLMGAGFVAWYLSPLPWLAAPVAFAVGFGTYLFHNTLQANASQMAPAARGSAMALFAFCLFMGQAAGVSLAGFAYDHAGAAVLLLPPAVLLPLIGWAFAGAIGRRAA